MNRLSFSLVCLVLLAFASSANAQSLGTFYWRLVPFNIVVTVAVNQQGPVYVLNGYEKVCTGTLRRPVSGVAVPQANGTIVFGFTTIDSDGFAYHTRATISSYNFTGSWQDDLGNVGSFAFSPVTSCADASDADSTHEDEDGRPRRGAPDSPQ